MSILGASSISMMSEFLLVCVVVVQKSRANLFNKENERKTTSLCMWHDATTEYTKTHSAESHLHVCSLYRSYNKLYECVLHTCVVFWVHVCFVCWMLDIFETSCLDECDLSPVFAGQAVFLDIGMRSMDSWSSSPTGLSGRWSGCSIPFFYLLPLFCSHPLLRCEGCTINSLCKYVIVQFKTR